MFSSQDSVLFMLPASIISSSCQQAYNSCFCPAYLPFLQLISCILYVSRIYIRLLFLQSHNQTISDLLCQFPQISGILYVWDMHKSLFQVVNHRVRKKIIRNSYQLISTIDYSEIFIWLCELYFYGL